MMVPRLKLIALTALILLPAALAVARDPAWQPAGLTAAVLLGLVAAADAVAGRRRTAGIAADAPPIVRMTAEQDSTIPIHVSKPEAATLTLHVGLALPAAIARDRSVEQIHLAAGQARHTLRWPCRALRRGRFALTACHIELPSPLGLWGMRRRLPLNLEIRVYPNLTGNRQHILGLFDRREWGWRTLRKMGKGREFEQLRDYLPGDNYEDVDWKATARRRFPVTRVYQVEQSQEIYVVLDASRLSTRNVAFARDRRRQRPFADSATVETIFERYITACLVMALAADRAGDRLGLVIFGARPDCLVKAGRGRAHYNACREALYNRMAETVSPDFNELFAFLGTHVRKRALLLFLTHLDDPLMAESFIGAMGAGTRQHVVRVNMLRPPGAHPLFSSADVHSPAGIYEHLTGHMTWSALSDTRRRLWQSGADLALLDKDRLCSQLIGQYMEIKQRQLL